ncbi:hypothetical protein BJX66DRAFT_345603 [Aspergillus keveii]|uniref:Rhodopsin domain-containing protein n=1 Tax=Aspergillus keveii TaxID=714993 RepID=A0ABR4FHI9_9EURO
MATTQTNADLDENHAVNVHIVGCVFTGIAIATVGLKITARQMVKRLGWDDFFIIFSLGLSVIAAAFVSYLVTLGLGHHNATPIADHGMERVNLTAKLQFVTLATLNAINTKAGSFSSPNIIAMLINNLLDPNPLRAHFLMGMTIMYHLRHDQRLPHLPLQCTPTAALWDHTIMGSCWPESVFNKFRLGHRVLEHGLKYDAVSTREVKEK